MNMRKLLCVLTFILFATVNCSGSSGSKIAAYDPTSDGGDDSGATPPSVSTSQPLAIQMSIQFKGVSYSQKLTFSETGTDTCAATASSPVATCTVVVPEGRLYYSDLKIAYSWMPQSCRLMTFQPYYYQASNSAAYVKPGADSAVDCSGILTADCFGGPAKELVTNFPKKVALIYLPDETTLSVPQQNSVKITSAFENDWRSNRHTVNDLPTAKQSSSYNSTTLGGGGDEYVADTFVNYSFSCQDEWADPITYKINLNIRDEDTSASGLDDFLTWKHIP